MNNYMSKESGAVFSEDELDQWDIDNAEDIEAKELDCWKKSYDNGDLIDVVYKNGEWEEV